MRSALWITIFAWIVIASANAEEADDPFAMSLEQLLQQPVTGSRLQHEKWRNSAAVFYYNRDEIVASGADSLAEFLARLPINGSVLNANGSAGTAHGTASVNLRHLGENRSLVLLNGRRLINGTATRGFRDFVDLNIVPLNSVAAIEILLEGASSVYGADAIAGVVNVITVSDNQADQIVLHSGRTDRGDGAQYRVDLNAHWAGHRTKIWGGLNWLRHHPIVVDDRDYSAQPLAPLSNTTPEGRYTIPGRGTLTRISNSDGLSPSDFRPYDPQRDLFNPFANTYLRYPSQQQNVFVFSEHDFSATRLFSEWLYSQRESSQDFSAARVSVDGADGYMMPADHPFNPFDQTLIGNDFSLQRVITPLGERINEQKVTAWRALFGVEGILGNRWQWQATFLQAQNQGDFISHNQVDRDHLALSLQGGNACAMTPHCVPIAFFGNDSAFDENALIWLRVHGHDRQHVQQRVMTAQFSGNALTLSTGEITIASGLEWRQEVGRDTPDSVFSQSATFVQGPRTTSAQRQGTRGDYDVSEWYGEALIPLQTSADQTSLQATLATRYSHYDTVGGEWSHRAALLWLATPDWQWRLSWSQGFRAPSLIEMYEGQRQTNLPAIDPCSEQTQLPGCASVPDNYQQDGARVNASVGGNTALHAERSRQWNIGSSVRWASDWTFAFDLYHSTIDDVILEYSSQQILDDCAYYNRRCDLISRDEDGVIQLLRIRQDNQGQRDMRGADIELHGSVSTQWRITLQAAYLDSIRDHHSRGLDDLHEELAGEQRLRASYPRWRALLQTRWQMDEWQMDYQLRYWHALRERSSSPTIGSVTYHDWQIRRDMASHQLAVGVNNLFDRDPPISLVNVNINFDISTYDPRGRYVYAQWRYQW